jgi:hypothetical protein
MKMTNDEVRTNDEFEAVLDSNAILSMMKMAHDGMHSSRIPNTLSGAR